jgi:hypothetical protein
LEGFDDLSSLADRMAKRISTHLFGVVVAIAILAATSAVSRALAAPLVTASSSLPRYDAAGAINGERFSPEPGNVWEGATDATNWWWQIRFDRPRKIGAILQIVGDHPFVLRNAPRKFIWRGSRDGRGWFDLEETATTNEQRTFRLHRLKTVRQMQYLRLQIDSATGDFPTLREVEFYDSSKAKVEFGDWMVVVNTTEKADLPGQGQEFIPLARSCPGWENMQAQQVWLGSLDEEFVAAEPRPLCAFLSGNFKDWCEIEHEPWRGTEQVMKNGRLPIWASCGGAQGLAILAEAGVDKPWDCPHCRDPLRPKTPIYTHIGHTGKRACGDYSACVFERGPFTVRQVGQDPVFRGLPSDFVVMESHCGQIEWPPQGWLLVAGAGPGTQTKTQCLRMQDRYIYAAQFHIEMAGTPENSRQIMGNFLGLAKAWGGYKLKSQ